MGARIKGKLVQPGKRIPFTFVPEFWEFMNMVMPLFIDKDITIEISELKSPTEKVRIDIDRTTLRRLAKLDLPSSDARLKTGT